MIIIRNINNKRVVEEVDKKAFCEGKELDLIDYSETTAHKVFCEIRIKETGQRFLAQYDKIRMVEK